MCDNFNNNRILDQPLYPDTRKRLYAFLLANATTRVTYLCAVGRKDELQFQSGFNFTRILVWFILF